jgi:hypothetical protein
MGVGVSAHEGDHHCRRLGKPAIDHPAVIAEIITGKPLIHANGFPATATRPQVAKAVRVVIALTAGMPATVSMRHASGWLWFGLRPNSGCGLHG